jgi:uncharacterized phage protein (TIGR02218 family)
MAAGGGMAVHLEQPLDSPAHYAGGRARVLDGSMAGLDRRIERAVGTTLMLDEKLAVGLEPGVRIELREGCDKLFATCRDRFGNCAAFDGEPHVPGADALLRYVDP